jgi:hypothetical protein
VTHRLNTKARSVFARAAALIAAYAFVLQTVLAPIAAAAATKGVSADSASLVLCAEHTASPEQTPPVAPQHHEAICKFCLGCPPGALLAPDTLSSAAVDFATTPLRWHVLPHFVSDREFLAGTKARGPPALT